MTESRSQTHFQGHPGQISTSMDCGHAIESVTQSGDQQIVVSIHPGDSVSK